MRACHCQVSCNRHLIAKRQDLHSSFSDPLAIVPGITESLVRSWYVYLLSSLVWTEKQPKTRSTNSSFCVSGANGQRANGALPFSQVTAEGRAVWQPFQSLPHLCRHRWTVQVPHTTVWIKYARWLRNSGNIPDKITIFPMQYGLETGILKNQLGLIC